MLIIYNITEHPSKATSLLLCVAAEMQYKSVECCSIRKNGDRTEVKYSDRIAF